MSRRNRWLLVAGAAIALVAATDAAGSYYLQSARASAALTRRLEAAFGRPVEVGKYSFSLWPGPRIEADAVTVGEDPRFGQEYFLRAQSVAATLRWSSLARGRVEFGTFTFSRPSLNVVTAGGRWNLTDWLPPACAPPSPASTGKPASPPGGRGRSQTPLLRRIQIDGGRINFKRGVEKLPFALVDVRGSVDERAPGRWWLALEARPMRVAVNLQDAGLLKLEGEVGGTSARLRPANLELRWNDASLSDVSRLIRGYDSGIRGRQDLELLASSTGDEWRFELAARAHVLHRWDMAAEPGDPALNFRIAGVWEPGRGRLAVTGGRIEAPESLAAVTGEADWPVESSAGSNAVQHGPQVSVHINAAGISAEDLLAFYRAFRPGISSGLHASGWLQGTADLAGWPPEILQASVSAAGLHLEGGSLPAPVTLSAANAQISDGQAQSSLSGLDFGKQAGEFEVSARARRDRQWNFQMRAAGTSPQIGALLSAAKALGVNPPGYWNQFTGRAKVELDCAGSLSPFARSFRETMEFQDAVWREASLPAKVLLANARVIAGGGRVRLDVRQASAMGAHWSGWLERDQPKGPWQFDLKADRLDVRSLAARLRPQPRQTSLLERIFGSGRAAGSGPSWLASLNARGRLEVGQIQVKPLALDKVEGMASIRNGVLELTQAQARIAGGEARGQFFFSVVKRVPIWHVRAQVANVDLTRQSPALEGPAERRFAGLASGTVDLGVRGATAEELLHSADGSARVVIRGAVDRQVDWLASLRAGRVTPGRSSFGVVTASLRVDGGKISFRDLRLAGSRGQVEASGGIDFAGRGGATLAVEARLAPSRRGLARGSALAAPTFQVTGSAADPLIRPSRGPDPPSGSLPSRDAGRQVPLGPAGSARNHPRRLPH